MVASKARRSSAALSAGTPGGATKGRAMAVGPTMSSSNLRSRVFPLWKNSRNAHEMGIYWQSINSPPGEKMERIGTKVPTLEQKVPHFFPHYSPSVHGFRKRPS